MTNGQLIELLKTRPLKHKVVLVDYDYGPAEIEKVVTGKVVGLGILPYQEVGFRHESCVTETEGEFITRHLGKVVEDVIVLE